MYCLLYKKVANFNPNQKKSEKESQEENERMWRNRRDESAKA